MRGGIGEVTRHMSDAAREAGAEVRTDAEVDQVLTAAAASPAFGWRTAKR